MRDIVLKPTVVIGLGGSGFQTLLNLKTRVVEAFGRVPPSMAFLAFDTTQNTDTVRRTSRGEEVSLTKGESVRLMVDNPHRFLQTNPAIRAWFPSGLDTQAIVAGAGMVRARGRLSFFYEFQRYQQAINEAKTRVRLLDNRGSRGGAGEGFGIAQEPSEVNVFICSSICGGTGAGSFLDTAWLARDGLAGGSQVTGLLFLPRIFRANVRPSPLVYKNAYSALKELDHWMSGPTPGVIDYGATRLNVTRAPFDLVYLLDGVNRDNQVIADLPQLYQFAAEALFLMIASHVGQAGTNTLDNVSNNLAARPTVKGKKAIYASLGVGRLRYPVRHTTAVATAREAVRLGREQLLNGQANTAQLESDVQSFFVRTGLTEEGGVRVLDRLIGLPEGGIFSPSINLGDVDANKNAGINARQFGELRRNNELTALQRHLERNYATLHQTVQAELGAWFPAAIESRANGISHAINFAHTLQVQLESWGQRLVGETADYTSRLERINVAGALAAVEQAAQRKIFGKQHLINMIAEYGHTLTTACQLTVEIERRNTAAQLFVSIDDSLKALIQQLENVRSVCRGVVDDLEHALDQSLHQRPDGGFERRISAPEPEPGDLSTSIVEFLARKPGRMIDWTFTDRERIGRELLTYVHGKVARVMTPRLEEAVGASDLPEQMTELDRVSRPLWQYERAELPPQTAETMTFYIYGVEDKDTTLLRRPEVTAQLPAGQGPPSIVGTNDPETIYQLQIEAGVPLFALRDLQRWKNDYDDPALPTGHVMEDAKQFSDVLPDAGTTEALRVFALAVSDVFKIIRQEITGILTASEVRYSLTRKRGTMREETVQLGEGRVNAYRAFMADDALVQDVAGRILKQQAAMEQEAMVADLQAWYRTLEHKMQQANWPFHVKAHIEQELDSIDQHLASLDRNAMSV